MDDNGRDSLEEILRTVRALEEQVKELGDRLDAFESRDKFQFLDTSLVSDTQEDQPAEPLHGFPQPRNPSVPSMPVPEPMPSALFESSNAESAADNSPPRRQMGAGISEILERKLLASSHSVHSPAPPTNSISAFNRASTVAKATAGTAMAKMI